MSSISNLSERIARANAKLDTKFGKTSTEFPQSLGWFIKIEVYKSAYREALKKGKRKQ